MALRKDTRLRVSLLIRSKAMGRRLPSSTVSSRNSTDKVRRVRLKATASNRVATLRHREAIRRKEGTIRLRRRDTSGLLEAKNHPRCM